MSIDPNKAVIVRDAIQQHVDRLLPGAMLRVSRPISPAGQPDVSQCHIDMHATSPVLVHHGTTLDDQMILEVTNDAIVCMAEFLFKTFEQHLNPEFMLAASNRLKAHVRQRIAEKLA